MFSKTDTTTLTKALYITQNKLAEVNGQLRQTKQHLNDLEYLSTTLYNTSRDLQRLIDAKEV